MIIPPLHISPLIIALSIFYALYRRGGKILSWLLLATLETIADHINNELDPNYRWRATNILNEAIAKIKLNSATLSTEGQTTPLINYLAETAVRDRLARIL